MLAEVLLPPPPLQFNQGDVRGSSESVHDIRPLAVPCPLPRFFFVPRTLRGSMLLLSLYTRDNAQAGH